MLWRGPFLSVPGLPTALQAASWASTLFLFPQLPIVNLKPPPMNRKAKPNPLSRAHADMAALAQAFKAKVCEHLQISDFAYYYRTRGTTKAAPIDEHTIDDIKREVLQQALQAIPETIS